MLDELPKGWTKGNGRTSYSRENPESLFKTLDFVSHPEDARLDIAIFVATLILVQAAFKRDTEERALLDFVVVPVCVCVCAINEREPKN